jgi:hypothetical protein
MGTDRYKRHPRNRDDRDDRRPLRKKKKERRRRRDDDRSDDDRSDYSDFDSDDDRRRRRKRKERQETVIEPPHQNYNQCPLCEDNQPPLWRRGYVIGSTDREPDYPRLDDPAHINYQGPELPDAFAAHYQPGNYCFGTAFREAGYVKPPAPVPKEVVEEKEDRNLKKRREKRARKEKYKREKPVRERKAKARDYRTFRHRHDKYDDDSASDEAGSDSDSEFSDESSSASASSSEESEAESVTSEGRAIQRRRRKKKEAKKRERKERKKNKRDERRHQRREHWVEVDSKRFRRHARPFVVRARDCEEERVMESYGASCVCSRRWGEEWAPRAADRGLKDFERSMARCMAERGF